MAASSGSMVDFTGTLVRREHVAGQKYAQMVFHTAEGVRLALYKAYQGSQAVHTLAIGGTYRVKGKLFQYGDKTFVREPVTTAVINKAYAVRKRLMLVVMLVILLGGGSIASAAILGTSAPVERQPVKPATAPKPVVVWYGNKQQYGDCCYSRFNRIGVD